MRGVSYDRGETADLLPLYPSLVAKLRITIFSGDHRYATPLCFSPSHTRARSSYSYVKLSQPLKTSVGVAAGDNDACVPYIGSQAWTSELAGNNGASHFALSLSFLIPH